MSCLYLHQTGRPQNWLCYVAKLDIFFHIRRQNWPFFRQLDNKSLEIVKKILQRHQIFPIFFVKGSYPAKDSPSSSRGDARLIHPESPSAPTASPPLRQRRTAPPLKPPQGPTRQAAQNKVPPRKNSAARKKFSKAPCKKKVRTRCSAPAARCGKAPHQTCKAPPPAPLFQPSPSFMSKRPTAGRNFTKKRTRHVTFSDNVAGYMREGFPAYSLYNIYRCSHSAGLRGHQWRWRRTL